MLLTLILFAAIAAGVSPHFNRTAAALSPDIVISQVYGGGGNMDAPYKADYVELFNRGSSPASLNGWSIQYASSTGTTWLKTDLPNVTLQPGQYFLIQQSTEGTNGVSLPTPDLVASPAVSMAAGAGKVAIMNNQTVLPAITCPLTDGTVSAGVVDFLGYGAANCSEANSDAPAPSNTTAVFRNDESCGETDNNTADFATAAPDPRNTSTPLNSCYPDTSIDTNPTDPSASADASFTFSSADTGSTFECQLDSGGWAACTSPKDYTGLADGSHTFEVRATNTRGNTDPTPASYTWEIDTSVPDNDPPETTIDTNPTDPSNSADATFTFSADEPSTFECQLDSGGWAACTSPKNYTGLADGSHTFEVRATDAANNLDPTPATFTWQIDTTPPDNDPPETSIDTNPTDPSASANASFTFSADEPSTFECRLDGGAWGACTSPKNYTGLADGSHTFEVRATDAANNLDATPASFTWLIDTTPPPSTTDILVSTQTAGNVGALTFGNEDILMWDGSAWSIWFDGSAAGLISSGKATHNINAFWVPDPNGAEIIMSFGQNRRHVDPLPAPVDGMDLVRWDGLGFSLYFDGSDVGLNSKTQEKIDALHILPGSESPINGGNCLAYLLISTQGPGKVTNYNGGKLKFGGEDVLGFCLTGSGADTAGLWHMVLDGSAEGMPKNSLINLSASDDGQVLYLTTRKNFNVDAASGGQSMIYRFDRTTGLFSGPFFSAPAAGLSQKLDGLQVEGDLP